MKTEKYVSQLKYMKKMLSEGKCRACGKKAVSKTFCKKHLLIHRKQTSKSYYKNKKEWYNTEVPDRKPRENMETVSVFYNAKQDGLPRKIIEKADWD